jgi:phage head maturation protease
MNNMDKNHINPTEKREVFCASSLTVREGDDKNIIEGVAIVTEQETLLWEGSDYREIEVIAKSCINREFIAQQNMTLNLLHNRDESFARTPKSMRVEPREDGLHFEADIPDCDLGKRARALTENGTYQGCSFEFYPKDYQVTERQAADGKKEYVIRHTAFERITALTLAMNPAYPTTSVGVRELYEQNHQETEEEKAAREKAEREAREQEELEQHEREEQARRAYEQRKRDIYLDNFEY